MADRPNWPADPAESRIAAWQANHVYLAGTLVTQGGVTYVRTATGTSRAVFDATELATWAILPAGGGTGLNIAVLAVTPAAIGAARTIIAALSAFTVTFRDRPVMIRVHCGLAYNTVSGAVSNFDVRDTTGIANPTAVQGTPKDSTSLTSADAANRSFGWDLEFQVPAQAPGTQKTYQVTAISVTGTTVILGADNSVSTFIEAVER